MKILITGNTEGPIYPVLPVISIFISFVRHSHIHVSRAPASGAGNTESHRDSVGTTGTGVTEASGFQSRPERILTRRLPSGCSLLPACAEGALRAKSRCRNAGTARPVTGRRVGRRATPHRRTRAPGLWRRRASSCNLPPAPPGDNALCSSLRCSPLRRKLYTFRIRQAPRRRRDRAWRPHKPPPWGPLGAVRRCPRRAPLARWRSEPRNARGGREPRTDRAALLPSCRGLGSGAAWGPSALP